MGKSVSLQKKQHDKAIKINQHNTNMAAVSSFYLVLDWTSGFLLEQDNIQTHSSLSYLGGFT